MCPTKPTLGRSRPGTEATKRLPTSVGRRFEEPAAQEAWRTTLPALMHEVQAFTRLGVPPTRVRTVWMLGFQRRRVRRCEWETLLPNPGPLPQTSQTEATVTPFKRSGSRTSPHAKGRPTERSCEQVGDEVTNRGRIHEEHGPTWTCSVVQRRAVTRAGALPPTGASDPPCGHGETDELHRVYPHQEVPRARIDRLRPCIPLEGLLQGLT